MLKSSKFRPSVAESVPKWGLKDSSCPPPPPRSATMPRLSAWDPVDSPDPCATLGKKSVANGTNRHHNYQLKNQVQNEVCRPVSTHEDPCYYRTGRYARSQSTGTTRTLIATTVHPSRRRFHIPCKSRSSLGADDDEVAEIP